MAEKYKAAAAHATDSTDPTTPNYHPTGDTPSTQYHELDNELYGAIHKRDTALIRTYLSKGANPSSTYAPASRLYRTTFETAVSEEAVEIARVLLEAGADPSYSSRKVPPLHLAVGTRNVDMVRLVNTYVRKCGGAGVDYRGRSAVEYARELGAGEVVECLLEVSESEGQLLSESAK